MTASLHVARAAAMAAAGNEPEAKAFLRNLALSTLRHARALSRGPYGEGIGNRLQAEENRADGVKYAQASRLYRGVVAVGDCALPYTRAVNNAHWPELDSHGVFVWVHDYRGSKPPEFVVEVQILPADRERSQCCAARRFKRREDAERFARRWVAIGEAAIAVDLPQRRGRGKDVGQLRLGGVE